MHHFSYRDGVLHAEDVSLANIAAEIGTPFFCYSSATIERHYRLFAEALGAPAAKIFYAMKANSNLAVLRTLANLGAGADTVSEGEIRKAIAAGIPPARIVFSGVGKTEAELAYTIAAGIYQINIESEGELETLSRIGAAHGKRQPIAVRINPDVGAGGHAKITTGSSANKFGVSLEEAERIYVRAANMPGVSMVGLAVHIGSQILALDDLKSAFTRMRSLADRLRGQGLRVERLDLGGGLGIPYRHDQPTPPLPADYARLVQEEVGGLGLRLLFEPGRMIAGNAGVLVTRVLYVKRGADKTFTIVDAGMNDLMRPTLYEAYHEIVPVIEPVPGTRSIVTDVAGPVCETGDYLALARALPEFNAGDLISVMTAGAYGAVLASEYNSRLLVPEVLVAGNRYSVTRPRPGYEEILARERLPNWL